VWELKRPSILSDCQTVADVVEFFNADLPDDLRLRLESLDPEQAKQFTARIKGRNGYVVEYNYVLSACLRSNTAPYPCGAAEAAKAALFYTVKYICKDKVRLANTLSMVHAAARHVTNYSSRAEDASTDPHRRKANQFLQRFVNNVSGSMEVSGQQAVASLLGLHAWVSTDQFTFVHIDAAIAFLRGLVGAKDTNGGAQETNPYKLWVEDDEADNDYVSDEDSDYEPNSESDTSSEGSGGCLEEGFDSESESSDSDGGDPVCIGVGETTATALSPCAEDGTDSSETQTFGWTAASEHETDLSNTQTFGTTAGGEHDGDVREDGSSQGDPWHWSSHDSDDDEVPFNDEEDVVEAPSQTWGTAAIYKDGDGSLKAIVPQHMHYAYRGKQLAFLNLYEYVALVKVEKKTAPADKLDRRPRNARFSFDKRHPLYATHEQMLNTKQFCPVLTGR